ncbi:hypothetical protein Tco_0833175 [Tanacetum coccineum]
MKSKYSCDDYLYCANHTAKLIREQWVDTVDHDGEWIEAKEGRDSDEVREVSFYPRAEPVKPLEWKALENRLKPSSVKPPKLELKELLEHLEYAFLQEENQLPVVISSALSATEKAMLLEVVPKKGGMTVVKNEKNELIPQRMVIGWRMRIDYRKLNNATRKDHFPLPFIDYSFDHCLQNLEKMLKRYEETNLVLNWEKCHFMVKEGIVLGHKVSGLGIEVDKEKSKQSPNYHIP